MADRSRHKNKYTGGGNARRGNKNANKQARENLKETTKKTKKVFINESSGAGDAGGSRVTGGRTPTTRHKTGSHANTSRGSYSADTRITTSKTVNSNKNLESPFKSRTGGRTTTSTDTTTTRRRPGRHEMTPEARKLQRAAVRTQSNIVRGAAETSIGSMERFAGTLTSVSGGSKGTVRHRMGGSGVTSRGRNNRNDFPGAKQTVKKDTTEQTVRDILDARRAAGEDLVKRGDEAIERGQEKIEKEKEKMGKFGKWVTDLEVAGVQLAGDLAVGAATGGVGGMASMFTRAAGQSMHEAEKQGADRDAAIRYGLAIGGVEALTEKIGNFAAPLSKIYGKGVGDTLMEKILAKTAAKSAGGEITQRTIMSALSEGLEEMVAEGVEPSVANVIYANALAEDQSEQAYNDAISKGLSKKEAKKYADSVYNSIHQSTSVADILRAGSIGAGLGAILGGAGSVIESYQGENIKNIYGPDGLKDLAKQATQVSDAAAAARASNIYQAISEGRDITPGQASAIHNAVMQQEEEDRQTQRRYNASVGAQMRQNKYESPILEDEEGNPVQLNVVAAEKREAVRAEAKAVVAQTVSDNNIDMAEGVADEIAAAYADIMTGIAGPAQVAMFTTDNPEARTVFEEISGVELPKSNAQTRELLFGMNARNYVETAKEETEFMQDRIRGLLNNDMSQDYGKNGQAALAKVVDDESIDPRDPLKADAAAAFEDYYRAGVVGIPIEHVLQNGNPMHRLLSMDQRREAYAAGNRDGSIQRSIPEGSIISMGERLSYQKNGAHRGKLYDDSHLLTGTQMKMYRELAERFNVDIHVVDADDVNGYYKDKSVYMSVNNDGRGLALIFSHEITHHMKAVAPESYKKLENLVRDRWEEEGGIEDAIKAKQDQYMEAVGQSLTEEEALEEIIADATYEMFGDPEFVQKICHEDTSLAKTILYAIRQVLANIRAALANGGGFTPSQNAALLSHLDILSEFEDLWLQGLRDASNAKAMETEIEQGFESGDVNVERLSVREKDPPKKTIKSYKLFKIYSDGSLGALFIDKGLRLEPGTWYDADSPSIKDLEGLEPGTYLVDAEGNATKQEFNTKNPSKAAVEQATIDGGRLILVDTYKDGRPKYHNWGINGYGSVSSFAMRPGWHSTDVPSARHIGAGKNGGNAMWRRDDEVWAEISLAADVDYQEEAESNPGKDIQTHLPTDGSYHFKTNTNASDDQSWYISGSIRIDRIISDDEAAQIAKDKGVKEDLPRKNGKKFVPEKYKESGTRFSVREDDFVRISPERMDSLIEEYAIPNNDSNNYSKAWIATISPRDFLTLTITDEALAKWTPGSVNAWGQEVRDLNEEDLRKSRMMPRLTIDSRESHSVIGHEGRHRMLALMRAGYTEVPVVIHDLREGNKQTKEKMDTMDLWSQDFGDGAVNDTYDGAGAYVEVYDVIPINEKNRAEIERIYGGNEGARFSVRETTDGRKAVVVNDKIREDLPEKEYINAVMESFGRFSKIPVYGKTFKVTRRDKKEVTSSRSARGMLKKNPGKFRDKANALAHPFDILYASTDWISEGLLHERKDNIVDFSRGSVLIQIDGRQYEADVVVAHTSAETLELYDIVNMNPATFELKREGSLTDQFGRNESLPTDNVPQTKQEVKGRETTINELNDKYPEVKFSIAENKKLSGWNNEYMELAEGQKKYFKNSKAVDENGNLVVVYHSTDKGGFSIFDPSMSDDGLSLFFTSNLEMSQSYSKYGGGTTFFDPSVGEEEWDDVGVTYACYLNLANPLVIDCKGAWWNNIMEEGYKQYAIEKWIDREDGEPVYRVSEIEDDYSSLLDDGLSFEMLSELYGTSLANAVAERFGDEEDADGEFWTLDEEYYDPDEEGYPMYGSTRDWAMEAADMGFDGLILKNVVDNGGKSGYGRAEGDVYVAFNSNQVKAVQNENPTESADVRYSVREFAETAPSEDSIKSGNGTYMGFKLVYEPNMSAEAMNMLNYISVSDKFFALDNDGRREVLAHEVSHNVAENIENRHGFWDLLNAEIFGKKKIGPKGSPREGVPYYEGIFGDVGANSLDESITDAVKYYIINPGFLKQRSQEAFDFIDNEYKTYGFSADVSQSLLEESLQKLGPRETDTFDVPDDPDAVRYSVSGHRNKGVKPETKKSGVTGNLFRTYDGRPVESTVIDMTEEMMKILGKSDTEIKSVREFLDRVADFMDDMAATYTFVGIEDVNNAEITVRRDEGGNPVSVVLSAMVKNGEYPVNFDFSSVCKKREPVTNLINELSKMDGGELVNKVSLSQENLWKLNEILMQEGFETACLGCFVETKRYNIEAWADSFVDKWNAAVDKVNPNAGSFEFNSKEDLWYANDVVEEFKAEKARRVSNLSKKRIAAKKRWITKWKKDNNSKDDKAAQKAYEAYWKKKEGKKEYSEKWHTHPSLPNDITVDALVRSDPKLQKKLRRVDLISPEGIKGLQAINPDVYGVLYGHYGSGTPKPVQPFTPYNSEIAMMGRGANYAKNNNDQTIRKGNAKLVDDLRGIGGLRTQSFSDFLIQNVFDYMQMISDMAARGFPGHAYSKEIAFAKIFGMTGLKINMSIMFDVDPDGIAPGLDKDGNYVVADKARQAAEKAKGREVFAFSFSWDDAVALQNDPRYDGNVGTIGVGLSDQHIFKMLDDPEIKFIIPYHKSGLPEPIAKRTGLNKAQDYTTTQNTVKIKKLTDAKGKNHKGEYGKAYFTGLYKELGSWRKVFERFNKEIDDKGYKIEVTKASDKGATVDFDLYTGDYGLDATQDPKQTAENYFEYCVDNGWLPLFYQFAGHENYYKVLYDFNVYKNDGTFAPQNAVENTYPDDLFDIIEGYMKAANEEKQALAPRMEIVKERSQKMLMGETKYSIRETDSEGNKLSDAQREFFKDSKVVDAYGNLLVMYHGSLEDFDTFDKEKIRATDYDAPFNGFWFSSYDEGADPAFREAKFRKSYYLNITNPAPYSVYRKVSKDVQNEYWTKELPTRSRSFGDETRYKLQEMGYDGVHFDGAYKFTEENVKEYNEKGITTFEDAKGKLYDLSLSEYDDARLYPHNTFAEIMPYMSAEDFFEQNSPESPYRIADVWVAFEPNQIKAIGNYNPTAENEDTRYSLPEQPTEDDAINSINLDDELAAWEYDGSPYAEAGKRVREKTYDELKAKVEQLKKDKRLTHGRVLDTKPIRKDIEDMLRTMANIASEAGNPVLGLNGRMSKENQKLVNDAVKNASHIYKLMKKGHSAEAVTTAMNVVDDIVERIQVIDDAEYDTYKEMSNYFRKTPITVPEDIRNGIPGFKDIRKDLRGKMRLVNDGGAEIDSAYMELCELFPGIFDEEIINPEDQLIAMIDARDMFKPYDVMLTASEREQLLKDTTVEFLDIIAEGKPWKSWADKKSEQYQTKVKLLQERHKEAQRRLKEKERARAQRKLDQEKAKHREQLAAEKQRGRERIENERRVQQRKRRTAIEREKERAATREQRLKDKHRQQKEKARSAKERAKMFGDINANYEWLSSRLMKPSDDKHIPEEYKICVAELLQALDLQTERSKNLEAVTGHKAQKTFKMEALRRAYAEIAKEDGTGVFEYDGGVVEMLDKSLCIKLEGRSVDALDNETMSEINILLKAIVGNIRNAGKAFAAERGETIAEMAGNVVDDCEKVIKRSGTFAERKKSLKRYLLETSKIINVGMKKPREFFEHLGQGMTDAYMEIRHGEDKHIRNMEVLRNQFAEIFSEYNKKGKPGSEIEKWRDLSQLQEYELESGETIKLNPSQVMSLYCLMKREQAVGHILGSGVVPSKVEGISGKIIHKKNAVEGSKVMVTQADVQRIIESLSDKQIEMADKLQAMLNGVVAEWGNDTSLLLYNYRKFTEENYFPIKSDDAYLDSSFEGRTAEERIRNFGFTKGTITNANNPIVIADIFEVVADHCNKMSLYNAFAAPLADFTRLYNAKFRNEDGTLNSSVKDMLTKAYGKDTNDYIKNLMADLNNNTQVRPDETRAMVNKFLSNYKRATIGMNLRVAVQQPTAIVRAFDVIDPKYFVGAPHVTPWQMKRDVDEMCAHCPIARWKAWGHNDVDMARDVDDIMMNKAWSRFDVLTMGMYGALDIVTWSKIWNAVKREVKAKHPGVEVGSDEFWDLCNDRASEVFDKTQVVDSVLHRSQTMRSKDTMTKMISSFMAEPTTTFNMLQNDIAEARDLFAEGDKKEAAAKLSRCYAVFLANAAAVSAAAAIIDLLRGKEPGDDDDDKKEFELWLANFYNNFLGNVNVIKMIPYASQVFELFTGTWGTSNMAFEGWESLGKAMQEFEKFIRGESKKSQGEIMLMIANGLGSVLGIPVKSVEKDIKGMYKTFGMVFATEDVEVETDDGTLVQYTEPSLLDKFFSMIGVKDGSATDNFLNKLGVNMTEEEKRKAEFDAKVNEINQKVEGLKGQERQDKIWGLITHADGDDYPGLSGLLDNADYDGVADMRKLMKACKGDLDKFDDTVMKKSKTNYKKTIGVNIDDETWERQDKIYQYMSEHGMSEAEISDLAYHSDTAKEFKKAYVLRDKDAMINTLKGLREAGITYEDYTKLCKYASRSFSASDFATGELSWPTNGSVTSGFGPRSAPTSGASSYHQAIDIGAPTGTPVTAADGGKVVYVGWYGGYGNQVVIDHGNGVKTYYSHLSSYDVEEGQIVKKGQDIAKVGSTGVSTGPHLDFKVWSGDSYVDPQKYLPDK